MADASSSASSSSRADFPFLGDRKDSDSTAVQLREFAGDSQLEAAAPLVVQPRGTRFLSSLSAKHPKLTRVIKYVRGPRPKVDLPSTWGH